MSRSGFQFQSTRVAARLVVTAALALSMIGAISDGVEAAAPPVDSSAFTPIAPQRLVDTRNGTGVAMQRVSAGTSIDVQVTGRLGIPDFATAAMINVTAAGAAGPGYVQVLPTGRAVIGSASTLNVDSAGQDLPNAAFAALGDGGKITVYSTFTTDIVIDVSGYFTPSSGSTAGRLVPLSPSRILDTRIGLGWTPPAPPPTPTPPTPTPPVTPRSHRR